MYQSQTRGQYEINCDDNDNLVRVTATGAFDLALAKNMVTNARARSAKRDYPVLYDLRAVETSVCESDLYELIHALPALQTRNARDCSAAVVIGRAIPGSLQRYGESEAADAQLSVRVFFQLDKALQWLHIRPCCEPGAANEEGQPVNGKKFATGI